MNRETEMSGDEFDSLSDVRTYLLRDYACLEPVQ